MSGPDGVSEKTWLITGAGRGLGLAFARAALDHGDRVVGTARRPDALRETLRGYGERALVLGLDVDDSAAVRATVRHALAAMGHLDVVVNNAGYGLSGAVEEVTEAQVRAQFDTNFFGALWVTQAVLPHMRARRSGHIVQISSVAGIVAALNLGIYCASKGALEAMSETLAAEVRHLGIKVTIIEPSGFRTDWSGGSMERAEHISDYDDVLSARRAALTDSGTAAGDPTRAATALLRVVSHPSPPLRLPLGNMAVDIARATFQQRLDALTSEWEPVARSTDLPATPSTGCGDGSVSRDEALRLDGSGLRLAANAFGSRRDRPLVLLHGGGQTRHAWGSAGEVLADHGWYALSVDLRGHGESDWSPNGDYRMEAFAADVVALATGLERPPVLVGASLGGLASLMAVGESDRPLAAALVLVDVTPKVEEAAAARIRAFMQEGMEGFDSLDAAADAISAFLPERPRPKDLSGLRKNLLSRDGRWFWHWDPAFIDGRSGLDGQSGLVAHDRLAAAAQAIDIPTLLIRGRMSDIVRDDGVAEFRELVPHARVVDVAGAGHMVAGDRNDAFNDAVLSFVRGIGGR